MIKNNFIRLLCGSLSILGSGSLTAYAVDYLDWVEWDKITHWAGDPAGENKCALVIDFQDGKSNQALVWGYRWNGNASGEDLLRAVAGQSSILTAMIQYTGTMGSTLNALGVSDQREELDYLTYDFSTASVASEISFGFFSPNINMGQDNAPGYDAEEFTSLAIERARESGIIEHPLNAFVYGYPAYDYDYWQLDPSVADASYYRWKSGWYEGYWSYWHGPNDYDFLAYSGLGMSSTQLVDGGVQAWKYTPLNGGEGFGATGGELAFELDYEMSDWTESMHAINRIDPLISHDEVKCWIGEGEKMATVMLRFNDGKGPENLVYGYRWSGGWDDSLDKVLANIKAEDPRLRIEGTGDNLRIAYDSDCDGNISEIDHQLDSGWSFNIHRTIDNGFNNVPSGRWLNPDAVLILSRNEDAAEVNYTLMRPDMESMQVLTIPEKIEYYLSDDDLKIPMYVNVPAGARLNTAFTWSRPDMLSRINTSRFMGTVSSYSDFQPSQVEVSVRGSIVADGSTEAEGVESNKAIITFYAPEISVARATFEDQTVSLVKGDVFSNPLNIEPANATYTRFLYRSSDPAVASVNSATGEVTIVGEKGTAEITATYNANKSVVASYKIQVGDTSYLEGIEEIHQEIGYNSGILTMKGFEGETVTITTISGMVVKEIHVSSQSCNYSLELPHGLYIINAGSGNPAKKLRI